MVGWHARVYSDDVGMSKTPRKQTLYDAYRFPGFTPGREARECLETGRCGSSG